MRIDRARLQRQNFRFAFEMQTRFSDLDRVGHLNNVAIAGLFQEGRNRFIRASGLFELAQPSLVVASACFEYASDLFHPDPVEVAAGILDIGRSSYRLGQIVVQNGRIGAYAEIVQVTRDAAGSIPLPEVWLGRLGELQIGSGAKPQ